MAISSVIASPGDAGLGLGQRLGRLALACLIAQELRRPQPRLGEAGGALRGRAAAPAPPAAGSLLGQDVGERMSSRALASSVVASAGPRGCGPAPAPDRCGGRRARPRSGPAALVVVGARAAEIVGQLGRLLLACRRPSGSGRRPRPRPAPPPIAPAPRRSGPGPRRCGRRRCTARPGSAGHSMWLGSTASASRSRRSRLAGGAQGPGHRAQPQPGQRRIRAGRRPAAQGGPRPVDVQRQPAGRPPAPGRR